MKPVSFLGDSLDAIRSFPEAARREAGFQIDRFNVASTRTIGSR
jgi:phage-related protein